MIHSLLFSSTLLLFLKAGLLPQSQSTKTTAAPTKKDSLLCHNWKLLGIEEFGVLTKAGAKESNDDANFLLDHKGRITHSVQVYSGNWSMDKSAAYVTLSADTGTSKRAYKIIRLAADTLMLEFKDAALVKTKYIYLKTE